MKKRAGLFSRAPTGSACALVVSGLLALLAIGWQERGASPDAIPSREPAGGAVHGSLVAELDAGHSVDLPGFTVELRNAASGRTVATGTTDRQGRFTLPQQQQGTYRLCWTQPGWVSGCRAELIAVGREPSHLDPIAVEPRSGRNAQGQELGVLWGRVSLADGSPGIFVDPFFGVSAVPQVSVAGKPVLINGDGEFMLVLPVDSARRIEARFGEETVTMTGFAEAGSSAKAAPIEIQSPNHRPQIASIVTLRDGKRVASVPPGAVIVVRARVEDPEGDALQYRWVLAGAGNLDRTDGPVIRWTLPDLPGIHPLYLLVDDGRGGYAQGSVRVQVKRARPHPALASIAGPAAITCQALPLCKGCPEWQGFPDSPFLTLRQYPFGGIGTATGAINYYQIVDPNNLRLTLGDWWTLNSFDPTGKGDVRASYLNHNDLGFGRDMHCRKKASGDVACYVTNYGCPDQNPANADLAAQALPENRGATVAMEYSDVEGHPGQRVVKFFVYDVGGDPKSGRLLSANLDFHGQKFVPQLCLNCHGGVEPPENLQYADVVAMRASFREFDLGTFLYPGGRDFSQITAEELEAFRALNQDQVLASQPATAIQNLVNGWYKAGTGVPDLTFAPLEWQDPQVVDLYRNVVALSCRTCHVALRDDISWRTYDQFRIRQGLIRNFVCRGPRLMPHAKVTYLNFWSSGSRPAFLADFAGPGWTRFVTCP